MLVGKRDAPIELLHGGMHGLDPVLGFFEEEWESLKALGEVDTGNLKETTMSDDNDNIVGAFEVENKTMIANLIMFR